MPPCLDVDDLGNLRYPLRQVEGIDAVRVRVLLRLLILRGEWFSDVSRGTNWPVWVGVQDNTAKATPTETIRAYVLTQLQQVDGVTAVTSLSVQYQGANLSIVGYLLCASDGEVGSLDLSEIVPFATAGAPVRLRHAGVC